MVDVDSSEDDEPLIDIAGKTRSVDSDRASPRPNRTRTTPKSAPSTPGAADTPRRSGRQAPGGAPRLTPANVAPRAVPKPPQPPPVKPLAAVLPVVVVPPPAAAVVGTEEANTRRKTRSGGTSGVCAARTINILGDSYLNTQL